MGTGRKMGTGWGSSLQGNKNRYTDQNLFLRVCEALDLLFFFSFSLDFLGSLPPGNSHCHPTIKSHSLAIEKYPIWMHGIQEIRTRS